MNTKELTTEGVLSRLHLLVIGRQGTGKTYSTRTFPKPVWIADFDRKVACLRGEDVNYDTFDPTESTDNRATLEAFGTWLTEKVKVAGTIVIDTLTTFSQVLMNAIREENGHLVLSNNVYRDRLSVPKKADADTVGTVPTMPEYQIFNQKMREILLQWRRIPCCFILNAHTAYREDEVTGSWIVQVQTEGNKISERIADNFGEVWCTSVMRVGAKHTYWWHPVDSRAPARTSLRLPGRFPQDFRWVKAFVEGDEKGAAAVLKELGLSNVPSLLGS